MNTKHQQLLKIGLITGVWLGGAACLVLVMGLLALQLSTQQAWILALLASGAAVGVALVVEMATRPPSDPEASQRPPAPSGAPLNLQTFFGLSSPLPAKDLPMTVPQPPAQRLPPVAHSLAASSPQPQIRTPERSSMKPTEKDFITRTLVQKYKLSIAVSRVVNTPDFYCYLLAVHQQETLDRLEAVLRNLGNDIYQYRRLAEPVTVKLVHQFPHLQVSKPAHLRRPLQWEYRPRVLAPHVTLLGASWNGPKPQPVLVNLADPKQAHVALFSSTGGGKSVLLNAMALGVMESSSPSNTELYFIDTESHQFDAYEQLPHVKFVARTEEDALDVITYLADLVQADRELRNPIRRVLVIDEAQLLTEASDQADEFQRLLIYLAKVGRKHRFNLWLATQDPTGDNVPTGIQRNIKVVVAGQTTDDSYLKRYFKIQGASGLTGDGDFLVMCGAQQRRFKSFWLDETARQMAITAITQRWGTHDEVLLFVPADAAVGAGAPLDAAQAPYQPNISPAPVTPPLSPQERRIRTDAAKIRPLLPQAYDLDKGGVKEGWGVRLIAAIYGEDKPCEGRYRTRMLDAVAYWLDHQDMGDELDEVVNQASRKLVLGWRSADGDDPLSE